VAALGARGLTVAHGLDAAWRAAALPAVLALGLAAGEGDLMSSLRGAWPGRIAVLVPGRDDASLIGALDAGADDAMPADASDGLVAARIAALHRRAEATVLRFADLAIDPVSRQVTRGAVPVPLLPREYQLLRYLVDRGGAPAGRAELLRAIWGMRFDPGTNVVEVHVSRLRARIDRGFALPLIRTARGQGYFIAAD